MRPSFLQRYEKKINPTILILEMQTAYLYKFCIAFIVARQKAVDKRICGVQTGHARNAKRTGFTADFDAIARRVATFFGSGDYV